MNIQKLRDMNLHTVADELERLREFKAKVESQGPVIRISGGRVVDFNPNYGGSVSEGAFYANPVPAEKPARITEQDVRDILDAYSDSPYVCDDWLKSVDGRALLKKLNADREQEPAVAVPDEVRGAIERLDKTQYRVIARRYRAGEGHQSGYTGGNIQINDLTICVEYIRDLLSAAPSHSQQGAPAVAVPDDMLLISRESLERVRDTMEFWINREDRRGMSESDYKTWLSLGHRSKGMTILREALDNRTSDTDRCPSQQSVHPDDIAVDQFADVMKRKLAKARDKGRSGWENPSLCKVSDLAAMLVDHLPKGDPVDVANFAMMLFFREGGNDALKDVCKFINSQQSAKSGYAGVTVWVGDKTITQIVSRLEIETSSADELLRRFENARHLLSQSERCPSHEIEQGGNQ